MGQKTKLFEIIRGKESFCSVFREFNYIIRGYIGFFYARYLLRYERIRSACRVVFSLNEMDVEKKTRNIGISSSELFECGRYG